MQYDGVKYIKVILVNFPKNSLSVQVQFGPDLGQSCTNLMSYDSLSEDLFEVLWHDEALQILTALQIFTKILACGVIVRHQSHQSIFQNKFLFKTSSNSDKNCATLFSCSALWQFFKMLPHDGIQQLDQSNFGHFFQKITFWGSMSYPIWAKVMQSAVS